MWARRLHASSRRRPSSTSRADPDIDELERRCREALPLLEQAGDHLGQARVWYALGFGVSNTQGRLEEWTQAALRAVEQWRLAGRPPMGLGGLPTALLFGPRPADEALRVLDEVAGPGRPECSRRCAARG